MKIQSQRCIPLLLGKEDVIEREAHKMWDFWNIVAQKVHMTVQFS
jgi:hypothetical protein